MLGAATTNALPQGHFFAPGSDTRALVLRGNQALFIAATPVINRDTVSRERELRSVDLGCSRHLRDTEAVAHGSTLVREAADRAGLTVCGGAAGPDATRAVDAEGAVTAVGVHATRGRAEAGVLTRPELAAGGVTAVLIDAAGIGAAEAAGADAVVWALIIGAAAHEEAIARGDSVLRRASVVRVAARVVAAAARTRSIDADVARPADAIVGAADALAATVVGVGDRCAHLPCTTLIVRAAGPIDARAIAIEVRHADLSIAIVIAAAIPGHAKTIDAQVVTGAFDVVAAGRALPTQEIGAGNAGAGEGILEVAEVEIGAIAVVGARVDGLAGRGITAAAGVDAVQPLGARQVAAAVDAFVAELSEPARNNTHAHALVALGQPAAAQAFPAVAVVGALAGECVAADVVILETEADTWPDDEAIAPLGTRVVFDAGAAGNTTLALALALALFALPFSFRALALEQGVKHPAARKHRGHKQHEGKGDDAGHGGRLSNARATARSRPGRALAVGPDAQDLARGRRRSTPRDR